MSRLLWSLGLRATKMRSALPAPRPRGAKMTSSTSCSGHRDRRPGASDAPQAAR